jgi:serine/threonine protein kinase
MALASGTKLGSYEILAAIGSGGMGEVYAALDPALNRRIALKVLPEGVAGDVERRDRFEREAKAIAALNHPNIVTIYSIESAHGTRFLTMELVEGQTLDALIPKNGLPLERFLAIAFRSPMP